MRNLALAALASAVITGAAVTLGAKGVAGVALLIILIALLRALADGDSGRVPAWARRLPELGAATAGGLVAWGRRSGEPHPFRRRWRHVLDPSAWSPWSGPSGPAGPADRGASHRPTGPEPAPSANAAPDPSLFQPSTPGGAEPGGDGPIGSQPSPSRPDTNQPASQPGPATDHKADTGTDLEEEQMTNTTGTASGLGTAGRAGLAGLVLDWETSQEARANVESFVAWLRNQAQSARRASVMVPELAKQFHGRGPSGHAGVPDQLLAQFAREFEEARSAEAAAYERFANQYAGHVERAESELTRTYGREVLANAHAAHQNRV